MTRGSSFCSRNGLFQWAFSLLERREVRYVIAGGWNTAFGYGLFCGLYFLFHRFLHYMVIAVANSVIAITMAYITYKLFVFRTKGNFLREYIKFYAVYGVSTLIGLVVLALCVEILGLHPYAGQAVVIVVGVMVSYVGHSRITFRPPGRT